MAEPGRIGEVVDVRKGLRRGRGVVVGEATDGLEIQQGSKVETVPLAKLGIRQHPASDRASSAGGRIYAAMQAASQGKVQLRWDPELLWPAIERDAQGDGATVVTLDLIELGDDDALTRFPLDDHHLSRLKAWHAHRNGEHSEALELLLEADPRSADLPAWSVAAWVHRQGGPLVTRTELLPTSGPGLVATVLHALSKGDNPSAVDLQAISPYLGYAFRDVPQACLLIDTIERLAKGETTTLMSEPDVRDPITLCRVAERLFRWDWEGAAAQARNGLRTAEREPFRDELLNLLACALWEQGNDVAAVAALQKAIEDEYSEALLANMGVVAANLDPNTAVEHFGKLADEAPNLKMRALAAERALKLWYADPDPWTDDSDEEEKPVLPSILVKSIRQLLCEEIGPDLLHRFSWALSIWDEEWFARVDLRQFGRNADSPEIRVAKARLRGVNDLVQEFARELRRFDSPGWLLEEVSRFVGLFVVARTPLYETFGELYNGVIGHIRGMPPWSVNRAALRKRMDPIIRYCQETESLIGPLVPYMPDGDQKKLALEFLNGHRDLCGLARKLSTKY